MIIDGFDIVIYYFPITLAVIFGAIAALHIYWAAGGLWPGRTERELIDTVIGNPHRTRMPPAWITALAAVAFAALALLSLAPVFHNNLSADEFLFAKYSLLIAGPLLLIRGFIGYLPFWRRLHPAKPFATYDLLIYSPLSLMLGAALIFLAFFIVLTWVCCTPYDLLATTG